MNIRTFVAILSRNPQYNFPKMRGGQRPFGTFPKIHPFWWRQPTHMVNNDKAGWCFCQVFLFLILYTNQLRLFTLSLHHNRNHLDLDESDDNALQATAGLDGAVILYDFKTEFDLVVRCYIQVGEIKRENINNVRCYKHKSRNWSLYETYSDISSGKIDGTF